MAVSIQTTAKVTPQCYAYTLPQAPGHDGWTKIGFTERDVHTRIKEQTHTAGLEPKLWWHFRAAYMTEPYGNFTDRDFHQYLKKLGVRRKAGTEWFEISPNAARGEFIDYTQNHGAIEGREDAVIPYRLREEQAKAVDQTVAYFNAHEGGEFLWNAKPRFGKTLAAYDLCLKLKAKNILIVTNRPAIAHSWYDDYERFVGTKSGLYFVSRVEGIANEPLVYSREDYLKKVQTDPEESIKGCIEFVSLQDLKGSIYFGGEHDKLAEVSGEKGIQWDILIVDEAHEGVDTYKTDVAFNQINRRRTLHLSGTPFKALANEKFSEEAIFNWTYADEQRMKEAWDDEDELDNPYADLPQLNLFTYQMSEAVREKASKGVFLEEDALAAYAFDLNEFFKTNESGTFVHEREVDKFLDALTAGKKFPFSTSETREELKHTFWLLNRVASAKALARKLDVHPVFKDYHVILAAGDGKMDESQAFEKSYDRVMEGIKNYDKTITLSVGQLTTGVTIPQWTAVLMLSNMASPALYMQAAFRAQNPCLFTDGKGNAYRKRNAYVFDFDPSRTLTIFEQFANDLIPRTSGSRGDLNERKYNIRTLLNYFPVYGEDDDGEMVALDAEKVLSIPRRIHAKEVVACGFMSNFLFANISGIFNAPKEIVEMINNLQPLGMPKKVPPSGIEDSTAESLSLNDDGEVEIPRERIIGTAEDIFGQKVYAEVDASLSSLSEEPPADYFEKKEKDGELERLKRAFSTPVTKGIMDKAVENYGKELKKSTQNQLERTIRQKTDTVVQKAYGSYAIEDKKAEKEREEKIAEAQTSGASMATITKIEKEFEQRRKENYSNMVEKIRTTFVEEDTIKEAAESVVDIVETERLKEEKASIEGNLRDHLRGFSRTIPAFLMAYGDEKTTLANFDKLVPPEVFLEVTMNTKTGKGVTIDDFRLLRDGGEYTAEDDEGNLCTRFFEGHVFDEVVFDDAVQEFMIKRRSLANYFDENQKEDIFNYIPPQRSNLIFTPKQVVTKMVDNLEDENPGCFDDPNKTFADLYLKSGMYLTEIVTRLYQSKKMAALFPDGEERLRHIFEKQVYGCAPSEIIYRICMRYILGFSDTVSIPKHNIRLCDTLASAKEGIMYETLQSLFCLDSVSDSDQC